MLANREKNDRIFHRLPIPTTSFRIKSIFNKNSAPGHDAGINDTNIPIGEFPSFPEYLISSAGIERIGPESCRGIPRKVSKTPWPRAILTPPTPIQFVKLVFGDVPVQLHIALRVFNKNVTDAISLRENIPFVKHFVQIDGSVDHLKRRWLTDGPCPYFPDR